MKRALVLAGGGAKGSYQVGVWKALAELGWKPDIITGTSVGCLNGALFVLDGYEVARDMWLTIRTKDVVRLPGENRPGPLAAFLQEVIRGGGLNVEPLEAIVDTLLDEDAMRRAPIRYGLVTVQQLPLKALELTLEEIPHGMLAEYMLASAACFPAFRPREIEGRSFIDGGYRDNMPCGLARRMGAEEALCVNVDGVGFTRPAPEGLAVRTIESHWDLGSILNFDPPTAARNMELGYWDTLRAFGRVRGCAYAVDNGPDSSADAAAFRARFDAVQKAVREKYPVTLTADAALLLARMKDAELAPLEAVAEDVGVDPTVYYTTRTLGQAFLDKCDRARMAGFAPLFAGSADAGRAALAALLPNTFLQALVWQALTAPELPEVTEHEDL